jgi:uncharacterized membrane protein YgdD (TMEM256/DUF423 family)
MMKKVRFLPIGASMMALGVLLGAVAAHSLEKSISAHYLDVWKTASTYFLYNGIAFMAVGIFANNMQEKCCSFRGINLAFIGTYIFSVSLWVLALNEMIHPSLKILGAITPIGGVLMIVGWGLFGLDSYKWLKTNVK